MTQNGITYWHPCQALGGRAAWNLISSNQPMSETG
jgi:hypothetical protein